MSQAEIAAGKMTLPGQLPSKGRQIPDFTLMSLLNTQVKISDYRGRRNLVLLFASRGEQTAALCSALAARYSEFVEQEAEVLVVVQLVHGEAVSIESPPFPVLLDADGQIHSRFGALDQQGNPSSALYITDHFGEVFAHFRTTEGQELPSVDEIVRWLEFLNHQCPECEPPEWPV